MLATGYALLEYVMSYIVCEGGNGGSLPESKAEANSIDEPHAQQCHPLLDDIKSRDSSRNCGWLAGARNLLVSQQR